MIRIYKLPKVTSWAQLYHICILWSVIESQFGSSFWSFFFNVSASKPISKSTKREAQKWALCDGSIINLLWRMDRFIAAHHRFSGAPLSSVTIWSFVSFRRTTLSDLLTVQEKGEFRINFVLFISEKKTELSVWFDCWVILQNESHITAVRSKTLFYFRDSVKKNKDKKNKHDFLRRKREILAFR